MNVATTLPDPVYDRLQAVRRSPRFRKVPSVSELVRTFIEDGLARLESAPGTEAASEGSPR